jgi:hypothetical protein
MDIEKYKGKQKKLAETQETLDALEFIKTVSYALLSA